MPRIKNYEIGSDLAPKPDKVWFDEMAVQRGFGSIRALSEIIVAERGDGHSDLLGRVLNRKRRLKVGELVRLAETLHAPVREVLLRLGYAVEDPRAELAGVLDGHGVIHAPAAIDFVPVPEYHAILSAVLALTSGSPLSMWHQARFYFVDATEVNHERPDQLCVLKIAERSERLLGFAKTETLVVIAGSLEAVQTERLLASNPVRWVQFP